MRKEYAILSMLAASLVVGCSDTPTPSEPALAPSAAPDEARGLHKQKLVIPVVGTVEGGTFEGTVRITQLALDEAGNLVASGELKGMTTVGKAKNHVKQDFTTTALITTASGALAGPSVQQIDPDDPLACDILFLDLGPISLNLLGLSLDLSQVLLDLDAIPGSGALLGNLLCVVVHLLDGPGIFLQLLEGLLDLINEILG